MKSAAGIFRQRAKCSSLGIQNAANSLGQSVGPLLGGVLFIWQPNVPYLLSGASLIALALVIAWKVVVKRRAGEFTL